jgi:phosphomannomutase/phosphoglucomutase
MDINPGIFKAYDIRGIWNKELFPETAYLIGLGMGTYYKRNQVSTVYVSRDNRVSGQEISENLIKGIRETGTNVVYLGVITTPMNYSSWYLREAQGSVSITASHNPPEYNGFKAALKKVHFSSDDYQHIKDLVLNQDFEKSTELGAYSEDDLWPDYLARVTQDIKLNRPVKVVLDCGNGTCSDTTEVVLQKIGCEVIQLFCEHDGSFPNHAPYPQKEDLYTVLKETIAKEKADMGIAMDGDGDRFGVYDEKGKFIGNDLIGALIGTGIAKANPGMTAVFNVSTSQMAVDQIENAGGKMILWKTGYPFIIEKMKETGALIGNEIAGHFFLKDKYYGFDDATYAAARFVEFYSQQEKTVSELVSSMPQYVSTPEFRVPAPDEPDNNKFTIIADIIKKFKEEYKDATIMDFDGLRIAFADKSWILIRNSNTEPLITGRAEAKTPERLEELKALLVATLKEYGVTLDWSNPIASH